MIRQYALLGLLGLVSIFVSACPPSEEGGAEADRGEPQKVEASARATLPTTSFPEVVMELDRQILASVDFAQSRPESWLAQVKASQLFSQRGRLLGSYEDYGKADVYMARAFEVPGCAAYAARGALNLSLHRITLAREDIRLLGQNPPPDDNTRSTLEGLQGELAFQTGDYAGALAHYNSANEIRPQPETWARLGVYRWKMGDLRGGEEAFDEAEALAKPADAVFLAWLHLQRGLMALDYQRYAEALAHYRHGDAALPRWWLIEEHIAEILNIRGEKERALEMYQRLIKETHNPEFMDAAAELLQEANRGAQAKALIARSRALYELRLATFPEATWGHALEHYLTFEPSGAKALQLAEANAALRPSAPAHINLARARQAAGDLQGAKSAIDQALASPWRSMELYEQGAAIYAAVGDTTQAQALRGQGQALRSAAP